MKNVLVPATKILTTPDGVHVALHMLGDASDPPVLLVPGTFSNASFWFGTKGVGFARTLSDAGYYACVVEPRGHGMSDRPAPGDKWDIDDWARCDIPTALKTIATSQRPAFVVTHSAGGAVTLAMLSAHPELQQLVRGVVAVGTPLPWLQPWRGVMARLIRTTSLMMRSFPARLLRLGPENELPHVMAQWMTWNINGHWVGDDGIDYTAGLSNIHLPFLAIAGTHDTFFAPPRACRGLFELVGAEQKRFEVIEGLDHVGLLVSRRAREEVWPLIIEWLARI